MRDTSLNSEDKLLFDHQAKWRIKAKSLILQIFQHNNFMIRKIHLIEMKKIFIETA